MATEENDLELSDPGAPEPTTEATGLENSTEGNPEAEKKQPTPMKGKADPNWDMASVVNESRYSPSQSSDPFPMKPDPYFEVVMQNEIQKYLQDPEAKVFLPDGTAVPAKDQLMQDGYGMWLGGFANTMQGMFSGLFPKNEDGESEVGAAYYPYQDQESGNWTLKKAGSSLKDLREASGAIVSSWGPKDVRKDFTSALVGGLYDVLGIGTQELGMDIAQGLGNLTGALEEGDRVDSAIDKTRILMEAQKTQASLRAESSDMFDNMESFGYHLGSGASSIIQYARGGAIAKTLAEKTLKGAVKAGVTKGGKKVAQASRFAAYMSAGTAITGGAVYQSSLEAGLSKDEAALMGIAVGIPSALVEYKLGPNIMTDYLMGTRKASTKAMVNEILKKTGGKITPENMKKLTPTLAKKLEHKILEWQAKGGIKAGLATGAISSFEQGGEEFIQESIQETGEYLYDISADDPAFGANHFTKTHWKQSWEATAMGAILGGPLGGAAGFRGQKGSDIHRAIAMGENQKVQEAMEALEGFGALNDRAMAATKERVRKLTDLRQNNEEIFKGLSKKEKQEALNAIEHAYDLEIEGSKIDEKYNDLGDGVDAGTRIKKSKLRKQREENAGMAAFANEIVDHYVEKDGKVLAKEDGYSQPVRNMAGEIAAENANIDQQIESLTEQMLEVDEKKAKSLEEAIGRLTKIKNQNNKQKEKIYKSPKYRQELTDKTYKKAMQEIQELYDPEGLEYLRPVAQKEDQSAIIEDGNNVFNFGPYAFTDATDFYDLDSIWTRGVRKAEAQDKKDKSEAKVNDAKREAQREPNKDPQEEAAKENEKQKKRTVIGKETVKKAPREGTEPQQDTEKKRPVIGKETVRPAPRGEAQTVETTTDPDPEVIGTMETTRYDPKNDLVPGVVRSVTYADDDKITFITDGGTRTIANDNTVMFTETKPDTSKDGKIYILGGPSNPTQFFSRKGLLSEKAIAKRKRMIDAVFSKSPEVTKGNMKVKVQRLTEKGIEETNKNLDKADQRIIAKGTRGGVVLRNFEKGLALKVYVKDIEGDNKFHEVGYMLNPYGLARETADGTLELLNPDTLTQEEFYDMFEFEYSKADVGTKTDVVIQRQEFDEFIDNWKQARMLYDKAVEFMDKSQKPASDTDLTYESQDLPKTLWDFRTFMADLVDYNVPVFNENGERVGADTTTSLSDIKGHTGDVYDRNTGKFILQKSDAVPSLEGMEGSARYYALVNVSTVEKTIQRWIPVYEKNFSDTKFENVKEKPEVRAWAKSLKRVQREIAKLNPDIQEDVDKADELANSLNRKIQIRIYDKTKKLRPIFQSRKVTRITPENVKEKSFDLMLWNGVKAPYGEQMIFKGFETLNQDIAKAFDVHPSSVEFRSHIPLEPGKAKISDFQTHFKPDVMARKAYQRIYPSSIAEYGSAVEPGKGSKKARTKTRKPGNESTVESKKAEIEKKLTIDGNKPQYGKHRPNEPYVDKDGINRVKASAINIRSTLIKLGNKEYRANTELYEDGTVIFNLSEVDKKGDVISDPLTQEEYDAELAALEQDSSEQSEPGSTGSPVGFQVDTDLSVKARAKLNKLGFTDAIIETMSKEDVDEAKTFNSTQEASELLKKYQEPTTTQKAQEFISGIKSRLQAIRNKDATPQAKIYELTELIQDTIKNPFMKTEAKKVLLKTLQQAEIDIKKTIDRDDTGNFERLVQFVSEAKYNEILNTAVAHVFKSEGFGTESIRVLAEGQIKSLEDHLDKMLTRYIDTGATDSYLEVNDIQSALADTAMRTSLINEITKAVESSVVMEEDEVVENEDEVINVRNYNKTSNEYSPAERMGRKIKKILGSIALPVAKQENVLYGWGQYKPVPVNYTYRKLVNLTTDKTLEESVDILQRLAKEDPVYRELWNEINIEKDGGNYSKSQVFINFFRGLELVSTAYVTIRNTKEHGWVISDQRFENTPGKQLVKRWEKNFYARTAGMKKAQRSAVAGRLLEIHAALKRNDSHVTLSRPDGTTGKLPLDRALKETFEEVGVTANSLFWKDAVQVISDNANYIQLNDLIQVANALRKDGAQGNLFAEHSMVDAYGVRRRLLSIANEAQRYDGSLIESVVRRADGKKVYTNTAPNYLHDKVKELKEQYKEDPSSIAKTNLFSEPGAMENMKLDHVGDKHDGYEGKPYKDYSTKDLLQEALVLYMADEDFVKFHLEIDADSSQLMGIIGPKTGFDNLYTNLDKGVDEVYNRIFMPEWERITKNKQPKLPIPVTTDKKFKYMDFLETIQIDGESLSAKLQRDGLDETLVKKYIKSYLQKSAEKFTQQYFTMKWGNTMGKLMPSSRSQKLETLGNYFINSWLVRVSAAELIDLTPDIITGKDFHKERVKRDKPKNSGAGISEDMSFGKHQVYTKFQDYRSKSGKPAIRTVYMTKGIKEFESGKSDTDDAQVYISPRYKARRDEVHGRIDKELEEAYTKMANFEPLTDQELKAIDLVPDKTVYYDGVRLHKKSDLPITFNLVHIKNSKGEWVPNPRTPRLYNMFKFMEKAYKDGNPVDQIVTMSASKLKSIKAVSNDLFDSPVSEIAEYEVDEIEPKFMRLQQENDSKTKKGSRKVVLGAQVIELLGSEMVSPDAREMQELFNQDLADLRKMEFDQIKNRIGEDNVDIDYVAAEIKHSLLSNPNPQLERFMRIDEDGKMQGRIDYGHIYLDSEKRFISVFKNDGIQTNMNGFKATLVSGNGFKVVYKGEDPNNVVLEGEGDFTRDLRMQKNRDGQFQYAEVLITKQSAGLLGIKPGDTIDPKLLKMFGYRIPTQSHHSMLAFKVAGWLPDSHGDSIVVPEELPVIMGADFDVDSLFIWTQSTYEDAKGNTRIYGTEKTNKERWEAFQNYFKTNGRPRREIKRELEAHPTYLNLKDERAKVKRDLRSFVKLQKEINEAEEQLWEEYQEHRTTNRALAKVREFGDFEGSMLGDVMAEMTSPETDLAKQYQDILDKLRKISGTKKAFFERLSDLDALIEALENKAFEEVMPRYGLPGTSKEFAKNSAENPAAQRNKILDRSLEMMEHPDIAESIKTPASTTRTEETLKVIDDLYGRKDTYDSVTDMVNRGLHPLHTPLGMLADKQSVTMSQRNVGIMANINSSGAHFMRNNVQIMPTRPIELDGVRYHSFGKVREDDINEDGEVVQNVRRKKETASNLLTIATDDVKLRVSNALNYKPVMLRIAATMVELGMGERRANLFINHPLFIKWAENDPQMGSAQFKRRLIGYAKANKRFYDPKYKLTTKDLMDVMTPENLELVMNNKKIPKAKLDKYKKVEMAVVAMAFELSRVYTGLSQNARISTLNSKLADNSFKAIDAAVEADTELRSADESNIFPNIPLEPLQKQSLDQARYLEQISGDFFIGQSQSFKRFINSYELENQELDALRTFQVLMESEKLQEKYGKGLEKAVYLLMPNIASKHGKLTIAQQYQKITKDHKSLQSNYFMSMVEPVFARNMQGRRVFDSVRKISQVAVDESTQERLMDSFRDIIEHENPEIRAFGFNLYRANVIEYGFGYHSNSLLDIMDPRVFENVTEQSKNADGFINDQTNENAVLDSLRYEKDLRLPFKTPYLQPKAAQTLNAYLKELQKQVQAHLDSTAKVHETQNQKDDETNIDSDNENRQYQKLTAAELDAEQKASEDALKVRSVIRDISEKLSWRMGGFVRFIDRPDQKYKGYSTGNSSTINQSYATLDTPFHEIMAHPIIRAIKTKPERLQEALESIKNDPFIGVTDSGVKEAAIRELEKDIVEAKQAYENLLSELEYGRGKEVLEQVQQTYSSNDNIPIERTKAMREFARTKKSIYRSTTIVEETDNGFVLYEWQTESYSTQTFPTKEAAIKHKDIWAEIWANEQTEKVYGPELYTQEQIEEEALVTLLGMMASEKLNKKEDAKLVSKLKALWDSLSKVVRGLLRLDRIHVDNLPIDMTLDDLASIMGYGNKPVVLPGYRTVYKTPLGRLHYTMADVKNEIRELANNDTLFDEVHKLSADPVTRIEDIPKVDFVYRVGLVPDDFSDHPDFEMIDALKNFDNDGGMDKSDEKHTMGYATMYYNKKKKDWYLDPGGHVLAGYEELLNAYNNERPLGEFLDADAEYAQTRDIIENWKTANDIVYDPEEVYSRGQQFVHYHNAYTDSTDTNLWVQNILDIIEDKNKVGGKVELSFVSTPIDKRLVGMQTGRSIDDIVSIEVYPESEDIAFASRVDNYTSSFGTSGALESFISEDQNERIGAMGTKSVRMDKLRTIEPNLAETIDKAAHHNEYAIALTPKNFRIKYGKNVPYETKRLIDSVNERLDQKYGTLKKPDIKPRGEKIKTIYELKENLLTFNNLEEAQTYLHEIGYIDLNSSLTEEDYMQHLNAEEITVPAGIEPKRTKDNLLKPIDQLKEDSFKYIDEYIAVDIENRLVGSGTQAEMQKLVDESYIKDNEVLGPTVEMRKKGRKRIPRKNYKDQASVNLKLRALRRAAKSYPRSLISTNVEPINKFASSGVDETLYSKPLEESSPTYKDLAGSESFLETVPSGPVGKTQDALSAVTGAVTQYLKDTKQDCHGL